VFDRASGQLVARMEHSLESHALTHLESVGAGKRDFHIHGWASGPCELRRGSCGGFQSGWTICGDGERRSHGQVFETSTGKPVALFQFSGSVTSLSFSVDGR
jgi:hypothetical protein